TSCKNEPIAHENNKRAYFLISLFHQCYWVTGTIIGAIAGQLITADTTGIDFSMTALFVVILVDQIRSGGKSVRTAAIIGLIIAVIMLLILGADNFLLPTLICTVIILYIIAKTAKEENA
ncbi:MAG: branched-chain amino acid transporter AzlC, partial [Clostridia bacterium]|nr:branched-chain amino acid transporter AzlC [Clostridia bacterium]